MGSDLVMLRPLAMAPALLTCLDVGSASPTTRHRFKGSTQHSAMVKIIDSQLSIMLTGLKDYSKFNPELPPHEGSLPLGRGLARVRLARSRGNILCDPADQDL
jgi:hypothetical protein